IILWEEISDETWQLIDHCRLIVIGSSGSFRWLQLCPANKRNHFLRPTRGNSVHGHCGLARKIRASGLRIQCVVERWGTLSPTLLATPLETLLEKVLAPVLQLWMVLRIPSVSPMLVERLALDMSPEESRYLLTTVRTR